MALVMIGVLSGCSTYEPATVENDVISNPKIGWEGYSIRMPTGVTLINPADNSVSAGRVRDFYRWYDKQSDRTGWEWYANYSEQFLMGDPDGKYMVSFISETFNIPTMWSMMSSVETRYFLQHLMNRKMIVNNDTKAFHEPMVFKDRQGWYISGLCRPYFKKKAVPQAYEGCFILGRYKEVFWIEGFGEEDAREEIKRKVREMAESLQVY